MRGKDEKQAEQLALRLAEVERQHAKALKALFGPSSERRPKDDKAERETSGKARARFSDALKREVATLLIAGS